MIIPARSQKDLIDYIFLQGDGIYISLSITSYNSLKKFREKQKNQNEYYFVDGQGAAIFENIRAGKFLYKKLPGCEVWLSLIEQLSSQNIALIGATAEVNQKTRGILEEKYKKIKVPVSIDGYQTLNSDEIIKQFKKYSIKYVFLALGQPNQECLARELIQKHSSIYMPIGGSFDILSGNSKRAPMVFRIVMLEWLYRIFTKPNKVKNFTALFKGIMYAFYLHF